MSELRPAAEETLYERIAAILDGAHSRVARSVNTAMVHAYWLVGREIVEVEQRGAERAGYGEQLLEGLARRLSKRFGRGMGVATLRRARAFYQTFPAGSAIPADLGGVEIRSTALIESQGSDIRSTPSIESNTPKTAQFPNSRGRTTSCCSVSRGPRLAHSTRSRRHGRAGRCASWSARSRRCSSSASR